jgi:RIO kinase 1
VYREHGGRGGAEFADETTQTPAVPVIYPVGRMLLRDVVKLRVFFGRFAPELLTTGYGSEIRDLYQRGVLKNDAVLPGRYEQKAGAVDLSSVMREIDDARAEEAARIERMAIAG